MLPTPPTEAPPGRDDVIVLSGVGKTFATGTVALAGARLVVRRGEFVSLLGPSGCGKTTVLRLVAGLDVPTEGSVHGPPPGAIGYVFQEPTLMPWARVFENVWLPLRLRGVSRAAARQRVMAALATVGLDAEARAYPRELSGGMKMRVSIARALVTAPDVILMDEPFAALDEITRFRLNDDLLALWRDSAATVLFVTHSVFESVYLSTRIAVMTSQPGRIAAEVAVAEPSPRTPAYRTSARFSATARETSAALARAMA